MAYSLTSPLVRIGLMRYTASTLTLSAQPGAHLLGPTREVAAGAGPWTITASGNEARAVDASGHSLGTASLNSGWRVQSDDLETKLSIAAPGLPAHHYRGCLEVRLVAGRLRVVNEVTLETYLRGVIGSEMGADSPLEALKAQAVASRTYALRCLGKWVTEGYDLRDTTDSQVYGGVEAESPRCDRAIRETADLILTSAGQPIWAVFSADCGGVTAPGATPDECPRSVVDTDAHASAAPNHTWTLRYPPERLAARLRTDPKMHDLGALAEITILDKDVSGRAHRLRVVWQRAAAPLPPTPSPKGRGGPDSPFSPVVPAPEGDEGVGAGQGTAMGTQPPGTVDNSGADTPSDTGEASPSPTAQARAVPAPILTVREIGGNALRMLLGVNVLRSTLFTVHRDPDGTFVFSGRGWGHGRGLCQTGAIALAQGPAGYDFKAILNRYYAGAILTRIEYEDVEEQAESSEPEGLLTRREERKETPRGR
jgi:stage II sporulation protein D